MLHDELEKGRNCPKLFYLNRLRFLIEFNMSGPQKNASQWLKDLEDDNNIPSAPASSRMLGQPTTCAPLETHQRNSCWNSDPDYEPSSGSDFEYDVEVTVDSFPWTPINDVIDSVVKGTASVVPYNFDQFELVERDMGSFPNSIVFLVRYF